MSKHHPVIKRVRSVIAEPSKLTTAGLDGVGRVVERVFIPIDQRLMRRNRNLATIPWRSERMGGKISYGEWAWVIGLMQGLIATHLPDRDGVHIIDVGCGTGLVGLAALPALGPGGRCLGLDVMVENIDFCRRQHPDERLEFELLEVANAAYAPSHAASIVRWPAEDASTDLVTALSVWTHLDAEVARQSMAEVARVLRPGGKALISFFIEGSANSDLPQKSAFHRTPPSQWIFDQPVSDGWTTPAWTDVAEQAVAIDHGSLVDLVDEAGLTIERIHPGYWREKPGLYFQDIVVLTKPA